MRDYKHLERDYARIAPETRNDGWDAAFWRGLERLAVWFACFLIGIAALWALGAALGFYFESVAIGFEVGRGWSRWLWEMPR